MANNDHSFIYDQPSSRAIRHNLPQGWPSDLPSTSTSDSHGIQGWPSLQFSSSNAPISNEYSSLAAEAFSDISAQRAQYPSISVKLKRGPKAMTMSPEKWAPCKVRIQQLYVTENRSLKYVRETVNREFALNATERQYKVQIEKWNLGRNVKQHERKYIVKKVQYRKQAMSKDTGYISVRGHRINKEKLDRWTRELNNSILESTVPRSPSGISIRTDFSPKSSSPPLSHLSQQPGASSGLLGQKDDIHSLLKRLCRYVSEAPSATSEGDMQTVPNDLKAILSCKPRNPPNEYFCDACSDQWNPDANDYSEEVLRLLQIDRNAKADERINVIIHPLLRWTYITSPTNRSPRRHKKMTSWLTPYGRVNATFSGTPKASFLSDVEEASIPKGVTAAKFVITPTTTTIPFCIEFDMNLQAYSDNFPNSIKITYHAVRPYDSEVFMIAGHGFVEELRYMLANETARLTDRDPEGRSLLAYAIGHQNVEMCRFLVNNGADPNGFEPNIFSYWKPLYLHDTQNEYESDEGYRRRHVEYCKILLEGGADFSLLGYMGGEYWMSGFAFVIRSCSVELLESILNLGAPFISPNQQQGSDSYPLFIISDCCCRVDSPNYDLVQKAILLIKRGADIGLEDHDCNTALHILLQSELLQEKWRGAWPWHKRYLELQEILTILITAGADVYASNTHDKTPTILASENGLTGIWIEALEFCGFDSEAVIAHSFSQDLGPDFVRQESKVTFEEYCRRRDAGFGRFEGISDSDGDTDEEESDEDIEIDTGEYMDGDLDQSTEEDLRAGSEVEGRRGSYDNFALHTQDHNAIESDNMEQPAEGWMEKDHEGIDEGADLGFNLDGIYGDEFMEQEMDEFADLDGLMEWRWDENGWLENDLVENRLL